MKRSKRPTAGADRRRQSLGQNFLVSPAAIERICDRIGIRRGDPVLEIGPGRGALTGELLRRGAWVQAIEIDARLAAGLVAAIDRSGRLQCTVADARRADLEGLMTALRTRRPGRRVRVVGNLPYRSATAILQRFLLPDLPIRDLHLMFQREVAARIVAPAGSADYGFLAVLCQLRFVPRVVLRLPPGAFRPPPKVHSALVGFEPKPAPWIDGQDLDRFRSLLRIVFGSRRKTLINNLRRAGPAAVDAAGPFLGREGLPADARPQAITPPGYRRLYRRLCAAGVL